MSADTEVQNWLAGFRKLDAAGQWAVRRVFIAGRVAIRTGLKPTKKPAGVLTAG